MTYLNFIDFLPNGFCRPLHIKFHWLKIFFQRTHPIKSSWNSLMYSCYSYVTKSIIHHNVHKRRPRQGERRGDPKAGGDSFITFSPKGGGGLEKWPIMRTIILIGCVKMQMRGQGVQNPQNFANVINGCPLREVV